MCKRYKLQEITQHIFQRIQSEINHGDSRIFTNISDMYKFASHSGTIQLKQAETNACKKSIPYDNEWRLDPQPPRTTNQ